MPTILFLCYNKNRFTDYLVIILMNKILKLRDEKFVKELFNKEVLPLYPDFSSIKKIEILPHKNHVWDKTYHVVYEFKTVFLTKDNKTKELPIFCSAHSDEPRENVFDGLKFLWKRGFGNSYLTIPHPLFYSKEFSATFYRGARGRNLYRFIREKNYAEIEKIATKAAEWFAKLHNTSIKNARNFNPENSRIKTVIPGLKHILKKMMRLCFGGPACTTRALILICRSSMPCACFGRIIAMV